LYNLRDVLEWDMEAGDTKAKIYQLQNTINLLFVGVGVVLVVLEDPFIVSELMEREREISVRRER